MQLNGEPRLWLHTAVEQHFLKLSPGPCEVGGWLLGYWTDDQEDVFVTHATPPGPRGLPWGVRISGYGHRERFDVAWTASGGHVTFLGDWHTHPGGETTPSERDLRAMQKLADGDSFGTPEPLIAIVSTPRWPWSRSRRRVGFFLKKGDGSTNEITPIVTERLHEAVACVPQWLWPDTK
jgi:integrative and conjugative element protein (TIGR02256 family)